jgi:hypothetical protein
MSKRATELIFNGSYSTTPYTSYDSTKINLGSLMIQNTSEGFAGPVPLAFARPMEESTAIASQYPHVTEITSDLFWIFLADLATAAATRRIGFYTYTKSTQALSWRGFITLTYPTATVHTIRAMRVARHLYTTGTVSVSGTAVTGSGTAWTTARYAVGGRIGFGSTDPAQITTWYHISAIGSDTSITLIENAGTIGSGTFVIEELRIYTATTNATLTNGGLFVAKGVNYDDFAPAGTTIAAAVSTDNQKAVYWLADASTVTNTIAAGIGLGTDQSDTTHTVYVLNADTTTTLRIYKYDTRVALSGLASGKSVSALTLKTGAQLVTGTISQTNCSRIATLQHGPGTGVSCIYMCTSSRVYRIKEDDIINNSTVFIADVMTELPTGSTSTFGLTNALSSVEYAGTIDRLIITTGTNTRTYVTKYTTASAATFDHAIFSNTYQLDSTLSDPGTAPYPASALSYSVWVQAGMAFFTRTGITSTANFLYVLPLCADWTYAAGLTSAEQNRIITPALETENCTKFYRVSSNHPQFYGSANLGIQPEPFRTYARTNGIEDDTGDWTIVDDNGNLSSFSGSSKIQFMYEFRMMGPFALPNKIYSLVCVYEDSSTDSHYQPSTANSSSSLSRFAWRFSTAFGGTVPKLTIKIYDALTQNLLLTDTTVAQSSGTFEKSTNDGSSWGSYDTTDKGNEITYIRYTPATFGTNIKAKAILTQ